MNTQDHVLVASQLAALTGTEMETLLQQYAGTGDAVAIAHALKTLYLDTYNSAPSQAAGAAEALTTLAHTESHPEIAALATWTRGMLMLQIEGKPEQAIQFIDQAAAELNELGEIHTAAATQISKIYALAMLGRYDEAIDCGLQAREVFLAYDDHLSAGKVEQNLGNLYHRRDQYDKAEQYYHAARARFFALGDQRLLTYANNGLANVLSLQHQFREAAQLYEQALLHAEAAGLEVTRAEIECNLGNLELFQGHYDRALGYLEQSRRRYAELAMPTDLAIAEQELADAYLALNLAPEAATIYSSVTTMFTELGMRAEQARALLNHGLACLQLGQYDHAHNLFSQAATLYEAEGNRVGVAQALLAEAQLAYSTGEYRTVMHKAEQSERTLVASGAWGRLLLERWLRGEAYRAMGYYTAAQHLLETTLQDAQHYNVLQIVQRCMTSLGLLAAMRGDTTASTAAFEQAIDLIETMRAPLPGDEFRTAFITDKLTPYSEMIRLCLDTPSGARVDEAFIYAERARARALLDLMGTTERIPKGTQNTFESSLLDRRTTLRTELNWVYSQINRPFDGGDVAEYSASLRTLQTSAREREAALAALERQLQQGDVGLSQASHSFDMAQLQRSLGTNSALVSYFQLDHRLGAFVVTSDGITVVRSLGSMKVITEAIEQLRFQIDTLRYGWVRVRMYLPQLIERTQQHLRHLYELLLRPLITHLGERRLIVVPEHTLYYVPFHALYDGERHVLEQREVSYAPSAQILQVCLDRPRRQLQRALLVGVQDARTPYVLEELEAVAKHFSTATTLFDQRATVAAVQKAAAQADVLHLACHGHFRPDNPLFSAIELNDGQLTVRDAAQLHLQCELVVLSACETGVHGISPGNEIMGLARGFMSAGTPSLLLSLWPVDDEATADTMSLFYAYLMQGVAPAAALQRAQLAVSQEQPHPFFWAPFTLLGRW